MPAGGQEGDVPEKMGGSDKEPGRVLALDLGTKRIGLAISDALRLTAQPLCVLPRSGREPDVAHIAELAAEKEVTEIVIGLPLRLDGSLGPEARSVRDFANALRSAVGVPVAEWDERHSTAAAQKALLEADASRARRKRVIDIVAAQIILQGYLDSLRHRWKQKKTDP